jgi:4-amino-4-deoxychorismate lyase
VAVTLCHTPLGENARLAGLKHLNRLEQVLAPAEWSDPEIAEGLMLDGRGRVICGTMSNLFLLKDGRLSTPRLDTCGIAGTVRARVLAIVSSLGIETRETDLSAEDLAAADGLLLTSSLMGMLPVSRLAERPLDIRRLPVELIERVRRIAFAPSDWDTD